MTKTKDKLKEIIDSIKNGDTSVFVVAERLDKSGYNTFIRINDNRPRAIEFVMGVNEKLVQLNERILDKQNLKEERGNHNGRK